MSNISKDELIEMKRRRLESMTAEESRELFLQACERADRRENDEYIRRQIELYKEDKRRKQEMAEVQR